MVSLGQAAAAHCSLVASLVGWGPLEFRRCTPVGEEAGEGNSACVPGARECEQEPSF